ncbi:MAG: hypothetical protein WKF88_07110 [Ferruginibacter sp.]
MKKLIICTVFLITASFYAIGQQEIKINTSGKTPEELREKSKGQAFMAGGFLFAAAVPEIINLLSWKWDLNESDHGEVGKGDGLSVITGVCLVAASGWFIASLVNKRKAKLLLSSQKTSFNIPFQAEKNIRGLTLAIPLGK